MREEQLILQMLNELENMEELGSSVTFFKHEGKFYVYGFHLYPEKAHLEESLLKRYNAMNREQCEQFGLRFKISVHITLIDGRTILDTMKDMDVMNFKIESQNKAIWN